MTARAIHCSWCGRVVPPKASRMRLHQSEGIRFSGNTLAHFHPDCGDDLLDLCEERSRSAVLVKPVAEAHP